MRSKLLVASLAWLACLPAAGEEVVINGRALPSPAKTCRVLGDGTVLVSASALAPLTGLSLDATGRRGEWFGQRLECTPGSARYVCRGGELQEAGAAARREAGDLWLPAEMLEAAFGWAISQAGGRLQLRGPGAHLTSIRQGVHPDRVRVVLALDAPCLYQVENGPGCVTVCLAPVEGEPAPAGEVQVLEFDHPAVPRVTQERGADGWVRVTISYRGAERVETFNLPDPPRIGIDFVLAQRKPAAAPEPTRRPTRAPPAPQPPVPARLPTGTWRTMSWPTAAGAATAHVLALDPVRGTLELRPALAGDLVNALAPVHQIARAHGALAAVNGGFFCPRQKVPLGMLVIDGEVLRGPLPYRPVFAIMNDGRCEIARVRLDAWVHFEGVGALPVAGLNQGHWEPNSVVIYTDRWGPEVPGGGGLTRLIVSAGGRVIFRETRGRPVPVPAGGMVISGHGRRALSLSKIPLGCQVKLTFTTTPSWPHLKHAVGGGPLLVADGKPVLDAEAEGFRSDVAKGRHPRTAVGILADGRVVLVAVEGPPAGRGPGLTLTELTKLMLALGARSAMNLDGGSSTTLVVEDRVVTQCSGGAPRPVNNALLVVPRRPEGKG
jgi:uncharacterized protein YigE (DUF2233 family)